MLSNETKRIVFKKIYIVAILIMCGCTNVNSNNKYNSVLYSNANAWLKNDFLEENLTYASYYNGGIVDNTHPDSIVKIVKTETEFNDIFALRFANIIFQKSIIILYIFTCEYMAREYEIKKIDLANNTLNMDLKSVPPQVDHSGDASMPMQRCFAIIIDKMNVEDVNITIK